MLAYLLIVLFLLHLGQIQKQFCHGFSHFMPLRSDFLLTVSLRRWPATCTVSSSRTWPCLWRVQTVCNSVWEEIQPQQNAKWILQILPVSLELILSSTSCMSNNTRQYKLKNCTQLFKCDYFQLFLFNSSMNYFFCFWL